MRAVFTEYNVKGTRVYRVIGAGPMKGRTLCYLGDNRLVTGVDVEDCRKLHPEVINRGGNGMQYTRKGFDPKHIANIRVDWIDYPAG